MATTADDPTAHALHRGGYLHSRRSPDLHESALSPERASFTYDHRSVLDHHYEGDYKDGVYDCRVVLSEYVPRPEAAPQRRWYVIELIYRRDPEVAGPMAEHRETYRDLFRRVLRDVKASADRSGWDWFRHTTDVFVTTETGFGASDLTYI
jgi:hypothetical protein